MIENCTIVSGNKFIIEWYFDEKGYSQAQEYFKNSTEDQQDKTTALFRLMANFGKIFNITKFMNEDDGIYAFKTDQDRYLCFFSKDRKIIITNAFTKKTQKLPPKEKAKAIIAYKSYIHRIEKGIYYEEIH